MPAAIFTIAANVDVDVDVNDITILVGIVHKLTTTQLKPTKMIFEFLQTKSFI